MRWNVSDLNQYGVLNVQKRRTKNFTDSLRFSCAPYKVEFE